MESKVPSVFEYEVPSAFLESALSSKAFGRGSRSKLAEHLGVQGSFISLVLSEKTALTVEQGLRVASFFKLEEDETDFFILLLQIDRAGSVELKEHFTKKKKAILKRRENIKNRIQVHGALSIEDQLIYYSNALYSIVHILTAIPEFQTIAKISEAVRLSPTELEPYLKFLLSREFIEKEGSRIKIGKMRVHLPSGSPALPQHHTHMRVQAIQSLGHYRPHDLHYSGVLAILPNDYEKVRELSLRFLADCEKLLSKSKPGIPAILNLDWFKI